MMIDIAFVHVTGWLLILLRYGNVETLLQRDVLIGS